MTSPISVNSRPPLDSMIHEPAFESGFVSNTVVEVNGARGSTVGVVAFPPPDMSPARLATRLAGLVNQSCGLGWIDDRRVCAELPGRAKASAVALRALLSRLEALHGTRVSDPACLRLTEKRAGSVGTPLAERQVECARLGSSGSGSDGTPLGLHACRHSSLRH